MLTDKMKSSQGFRLGDFYVFLPKSTSRPCFGHFRHLEGATQIHFFPDNKLLQRPKVLFLLSILRRGSNTYVARSRCRSSFAQDSPGKITAYFKVRTSRLLFLCKYFRLLMRLLAQLRYRRCSLFIFGGWATFLYSFYVTCYQVIYGCLGSTFFFPSRLLGLSHPLVFMVGGGCVGMISSDCL